MSISVIITSFNRLPQFKQTYHTLINQLSEEDELVVVEEGQEREWPNFLKTLNVPFTFVFTNNNRYRSCSTAKNIALRLAKNDLIAINEPEVMQIDQCIFALKAELEKEPRQFAVVGTMYFDTSADGNPTRMEHSQAPFVAMVCKKELVDIGGWDERYKYWGNDDNDLMDRLRMNGCRHVVYDRLQAHHRWHIRPPAYAMGDCNEKLLYEKNRKVVANAGKKWGKILKKYEITRG